MTLCARTRNFSNSNIRYSSLHSSDDVRVWKTRQMLIVRPSVDEWEIAREIRLASLLNTPLAYGTTHSQALRTSEAEWRRRIADPRSALFVVMAGDSPIATASGGEHELHPHARWLYGMYCDPRYRGSEVATSLVRAVSSWVRSQGVSDFGLHVNEALPRAVSFYRRLGFLPTGASEALRRDPTQRLVEYMTNLDENDEL
ncbi:MAG: GNAT family N-acetyltransferase [Actinomycetota bacterium]|jgi:GNAT superfamily N-acetyltransferase